MSLRFSAWAFSFLSVVGIQALAAPTYSNIVFATYSATPGALNCKLDIYIPTVGTPPYPVLVYVHGGGWSGGSRTATGDVPIDVLAYGIATVAIDYRLTSQEHQFGIVDGVYVPVSWPAQLHDCKAAIRWVRGKAATYGFDTNRICAFGTSAGGHLVAALGTMGGLTNYTRGGQTIDLEGTVGDYDNLSSQVMAVCDYFGPTDILNMAPDVTSPPGCVYDFDAKGAPTADLAGSTAYDLGVGQIRANLNSSTAPYPFLAATTLSAGPVTFARSGLPPMFIAHGDADAVVPSYQSVRLNNALLANGDVSRFTMVSGGVHGNLGAAMRTAAVAWIVGVLKGTLICPAITAQPLDQAVAPGGVATFTVGATGTGPLSYRWQKNQANLSNGGHYAGTTTGTLTITNADNNDVANYRCVVSNTCGAIITGNAVLTLGVMTNPPAIPVANSATGVGSNAFTASWSGVSGAAGYQLDVSTNSGFASFVSGYQNLDAGNVTSWNVSGLPMGATCFYRVRAYNTNGTSGNSATITVTLVVPVNCTVPNLVNGDFEGGNTGGVANGWTAYEVNGPTTKVWSVQTALPAPDGFQYQQIQAYNDAHTASAGVRQNITGCVIGATYKIAGWYRSNSDSGRARVRVSPTASTDWNTAMDLDFVADYGSSTNWATFSGTVVATGTNMTLWLDGRTIAGTAAKVGCFDSVTVTCVGSQPPLRFESVNFLGPDQVGLTLSGPPGVSITIQGSSNVVDWATLTNLANPTGTVQFTDTITVNPPQRFYRATSP